MLPPPRIRPVAESDLEAAIIKVGGRRAHEDAERRDKVGADFIIGSALIELKILEDDGLDKHERQEQLAGLFGPLQAASPVVVIDPYALSEADLRTYKTIMQGPIKSGIAHAKKQLSQSRLEHPTATCSVLMVVNNSFTALTHEELKNLVAERARNDTSRIDVVVVAGCYLHSDNFDSYALWPIDQVVLHPEHPFEDYQLLRKAWDSLSEAFMTAMVTGAPGTKSPETDKIFEVDGVRYIRPATPIGGKSDFYVRGRPRLNSTGYEELPLVATTFPGLDEREWKRLASVIPEMRARFADYRAWRDHEHGAQARHEILKPFVPTPVTRGTFEAWRRKADAPYALEALYEHAAAVFHTRLRRLIADAQELSPTPRFDHQAIVVVTDEIGQDIANDVSAIALVTPPARSASARDLIGRQRLFYEHAVALAGAYAIKFGATTIYHHRNSRYAWH
jgi:hypothetical protein